MSLRPCWSRHTQARLGGLCLAREAELLLAWDQSQYLYLWDREGRERARAPLLQQPAAVAFSDDGRHVAAVSPTGNLWRLNGRLQLQFDQKLDFPPQTLALEPHGRCLAISGTDRQTVLLDGSGKTIARWETPRPLQCLSFIPSRACLVGSADFGFVACFDSGGRCLWRDALVSHVGSLAADGEGRAILLACYSHGLQRYDYTGKNHGSQPGPEPCRLAAIDFDGTHIVAVTENNILYWLQVNGRVCDKLPMRGTVQSLVLDALGEFAACGLADGEVVFLETV